MLLFDEYTKIISNLPTSLHDVGGVLYSTVLTVISTQDHHEIHDFETSSDIEWIHPETNQLCSLKENRSEGLLLSLLEQVSMILDVGSTPEVNSISTIDEEDDFSLKLHSIYLNYGVSSKNVNEGLPSASGLLHFTKQALFRRIYSLLLQVSKTITDPNLNPSLSLETLKKLPIFPSESKQQRKLRETEVLNFSSLSSDDFHRYRQLQVFHKLVKEKLPSLPKFTKKSILNDGEDGSILKRRYYRQLSGLSLIQILLKELIREPKIITQYDSWTDELLYILYWENATRRMNKDNIIYYSMVGVENPIKETAIAEVISSQEKEKDRPASPPILQSPKQSLKGSTSKNNSTNISSSSSSSSSRPNSQSKSTKHSKQVSSSKPTTQVKETTTVSIPTPTKSPPSSRKASTVALVSPRQLNEQPTRKVYGMDRVIITPAGRSLVMIKKYLSTNEAWLTVHTPCQSILGLRPSRSLLSSSTKDSSITPSVEQQIESISEKSTTIKSNHKQSHQLLSPVSHDDGVFFCETSDGVRYTLSTSIASHLNKKPDGFGCVLLNCLLPNGLNLFVSSNGTVKIIPDISLLSKFSIPDTSMIHLIPLSPASTQLHDPMGIETHRYIINGGYVVKTLSNGLYRKDILYPNGTRQLFRSVITVGRKYHSSQIISQYRPTTHYSKYLLKIYTDAPTSYPWDCVILYPNGRILYYKTKSDSIENTLDEKNESYNNNNSSNSSSSPDKNPVDYTRGKEIDVEQFLEEGRESSMDVIESYMKEYIDAETNAIVKSFQDGRLITCQIIGNAMITETRYSDTTTTVLVEKFNVSGNNSNTSNANDSNSNNNSNNNSNSNNSKVLYVKKVGIPTIEVDLDIDHTATKHSKGYLIPINKGGDQIRMRIAMNDGSAIFVKYDTRITSKWNGSIKLVRRDKTIIQVSDNGNVEFKSNSSWDSQAEEMFQKECKDTIGTMTRDTNISSSISTKSLMTRTQSGHSSISYSETKSNFMDSMNSKSCDSSPSKEVKLTKKRNKLISVKTNQIHETIDTNNNNNNNSNSVTMDSVTSNQTKVESNDLFVNTKTLDTKFVFDLRNVTCHIEDYEYNCFDIDLIHSPLDPKISLAGEVDGLKPIAITTVPIDPRVFVINRSGIAIETLSIHSVSDIERRTNLHPEANKVLDIAYSQPSDLNIISQHGYYLSKFPYERDDHIGYQFEDIFDKRDWLHIKSPATTNFIAAFTTTNQFYARRISAMPNSDSFANSPHETTTISHPGFNQVQVQGQINTGLLGGMLIPESSTIVGSRKDSVAGNRVYINSRGNAMTSNGDSSKTIGKVMVTSKILTERLPLSQEGYQSLEDGIVKWKEFTDMRKSVIQQYSIVDTRTREQIEDETKIQSRLKKAYKFKKKLKKQATEKGNQADGDNISTANPVFDVTNGKYIYKPGTRLEGVNEIPDKEEKNSRDFDDDDEDQDEDNSIAFSSDDDSDEEMGLEEREIIAAFYEYGVVVQPSTSALPTKPATAMTTSGIAVAVDIPLVTARVQAMSMKSFREDNDKNSSNNDDNNKNGNKNNDVNNNLDGVEENIDSNMENNGTIPAYLPITSIRAALIQILNIVISEDIIHEEMKAIGVYGADCIYLSEFTRLYKRICIRLNPDHLSPRSLSLLDLNIEDRSIESSMNSNLIYPSKINHLNLKINEVNLNDTINDTIQGSKFDEQDHDRDQDQDRDSISMVSGDETSLSGGYAQGAAIFAVRSKK